MTLKKGIYVEDMNTVYITGAGYIREAFTGVGRDSIGVYMLFLFLSSRPF